MKREPEMEPANYDRCMQRTVELSNRLTDVCNAVGLEMLKSDDIDGCLRDGCKSSGKCAEIGDRTRCEAVLIGHPTITLIAVEAFVAGVCLNFGAPPEALFQGVASLLARMRSGEVKLNPPDQMLHDIAMHRAATNAGNGRGPKS